MSHDANIRVDEARIEWEQEPLVARDRQSMSVGHLRYALRVEIEKGQAGNQYIKWLLRHALWEREFHG